MKRIAVLDSTFAIRKRIRELATRANVKVDEATTSWQLIHLLNTTNEIGLIITELEFHHEDGFDVFRKIKNCAGHIPVMILTGDNKRSSFLRGISLGATDYVLKPYDTEFLYNRIVDILHSEPVRSPRIEKNAICERVPEIYVDFQSYLNKEIKKALKGNYTVSISISLVRDPENGMNPSLNKHYQQLVHEIHQELTKVTFDTDIVFISGPRSIVSILPFCGSDNQMLVDLKFQRAFQELKEKNVLYADAILINSFASYPEDSQDQDTLMNNIDVRIKDSYKNSTL